MLCCHIRKVEPLRRALSDLDGWSPASVAIRRRRAADIGKFRSTRHGGNVKVNPIAELDQGPSLGLHPRTGFPYSELYNQEDISIGCARRARGPSQPGEDERAGRRAVGELGIQRVRPAQGDAARTIRSGARRSDEVAARTHARTCWCAQTGTRGRRPSASAGARPSPSARRASGRSATTNRSTCRSRTKRDDDGLNVRDRIEKIYSVKGHRSIPPPDLRSRFRPGQRKQGTPAKNGDRGAGRSSKTSSSCSGSGSPAACSPPSSSARSRGSRSASAATSPT